MLGGVLKTRAVAVDVAVGLPLTDTVSVGEEVMLAVPDGVPVSWTGPRVACKLLPCFHGIQRVKDLF